jgi:hypothetical protein
MLEHDAEKCAAVFRKDHAQTKGYSAMMIHPQLIALRRFADRHWKA